MALLFSNLSVAAMNTVTTAQVLVTATTYAEGLTIIANNSNTGYVYIGSSTMTITTAYPLSPGEDLPMSIDIAGRGSFIDLASIYWMSDTTTNGIRVAYLGRST